MTPSDLSKIAAKLPLSESVRKLNSIEEPAPRIVTPPVAPLGQSHAELCLNKTEKRFLARLRGPIHAYHEENIGIQDVTLRLGFRLRYTPDFRTLDHDGSTTFWETKGSFEREDSWVKLKAAAAKFKHWRFIKAVWKDGQWTETVVRP